ncbi:hypothetical protein ScPMuIL_002474 [Solemya velum]
MKAIYLLFILWTGLVGVACLRPEIVGDFLVEVKALRQTAYLNCTVINIDSTTQVVWEQRSSALVISQDKKILTQNLKIDGKRKYEVEIRRQGARTTFMLMINRLQEEDSGNYQCYIQMQATAAVEWPKKMQKVVVLVPPSMDNTVTAGTMEAHEGDNITMICDGSGIPMPNITWTKEDGSKLPTGHSLFRGRRLVLAPVTRDMAGTYVCTADNNVAPPAYTKSELAVFSPPITREVMDSVGQAQNRQFSAILECVISGYPAPSLSWSRLTNNGVEEVRDNEKYTISKQQSKVLKTSEFWYTLRVKNVQANDFTVYYCVAKNRIGTSMSNITLFETVECQGAACPSMTKGVGVKSSPSLFVICALVLLQTTMFTIYLT